MQLVTQKPNLVVFNVGFTVISMLIIAWLIHSFNLADPSTYEQLGRQDSHLALLIVASVLLMILCALTPLPAEALTLANGMIFGPLLGTVITWFSAMLGAYITFVWSRHFAKQINTDFMQTDKWQRVNDWVGKWGVLGFLLARLVPAVPFFALNIGAAFLPLRTKPYLLITGIAILPHIFIICFFGGHLMDH